MTARRAALLLLVLLAACAPKSPVRTPEAEDYVFPTMVASEVTPQERNDLERAWRDLLGGHAPSAEKRAQKMLRGRPGLLPAETIVAYAQLRTGRLDAAEAGFRRVLERRPDDVSALIGIASTSVRRGLPELALEAYRRVLVAEPAQAVARQRMPQVRFQVTEKRVAGAHAALAAGDVARAMAEYQAALDAAPEVGGVRLELAELLLQKGERARAMDVLSEDPSNDRQVLLRLGQIATESRDFARAIDAYRRLLQKDPRDAEAVQKSQEARRGLELLQMPEEYRRIPGAGQISRADLAAVLATKLTALGRVPPGSAQVAVDISGSWAHQQILRALTYDLMDVYPNHTFQPGAVARRGDLARAVQRVLDLFKVPTPPAEPAFTDMTRNNLLHYSAARAVGAGLMDVSGGGAFEAWRPVSGQQALDVVEQLARLVGP